jgi:hypothetical protein
MSSTEKTRTNVFQPAADSAGGKGGQTSVQASDLLVRNIMENLEQTNTQYKWLIIILLFLLCIHALSSLYAAAMRQTAKRRASSNKTE